MSEVVCTDARSLVHTGAVVAQAVVPAGCAGRCHGGEGPRGVFTGTELAAEA
jgi:hypothetical protein